jgi:pimeloyl-ACP methyl ester carboxylesterase
MTDIGRARLPDIADKVDRPDGVRIAYEVFGSGDPTLVLLPSAPIIHSRQWKGQVPSLSRHYRVVTYDGRGNGRSSRPTDPAAYEEDRIVGDLEAVIDATQTQRAILVGLCGDGVLRSFEFAAANPQRVLGIVAIAVGIPFLAPPHEWRVSKSMTESYDIYEGWRKENVNYWRTDYPDFARWFFGEMAPEPHSTKLIDDAAAWAVEGDPEAMIAEAHVDMVPPFPGDQAAAETLARSVTAPLLIVHGTADRCQPIERARRLHAITGAPLIEIEGGGHMLPGRHPVLINLLIREFVESVKGGAK